MVLGTERNLISVSMIRHDEVIFLWCAKAGNVVDVENCERCMCLTTRLFAFLSSLVFVMRSHTQRTNLLATKQHDLVVVITHNFL